MQYSEFCLPWQWFALATLNQGIVEWDCVNPAYECSFQNATGDMEFCSRILDDTDVISECLTPVFDRCDTFPYAEGFEEFATEQLKEAKGYCLTQGCSEYLNSCESVREIIDIYDMAILEEESCVMCAYLQGVTDCFANVSSICLEALQYGLDRWDIPLNVQALWAPKLINFIRNTMELYFSQGKCNECIQKAMDCVYIWEYEYDKYGGDECLYVGYIGHCIAEEMRVCDSIWPASQQIIGLIVDDVTRALALLCYSKTTNDRCIASQAECSPYVPFFDFLIEAPLLDDRNIGFKQGKNKLNPFALLLLHLASYDDNLRTRVQKADGLDDDMIYVCDNVRPVDVGKCHRRVWTSQCSRRDRNLLQNVRSMYNTSQFICWLFAGEYNLDSMLELPWFAGQLGSEDLQFLKEILLQNELMLPEQPGEKPSLPKQPKLPSYPHVSQGKVLALKVMLPAPYKAGLLNSSLANTRLIGEAVAERVHEFLSHTVVGLVNVSVHRFFFRKYLGVDLSLKLDRDLDIKSQAKLTTDVALAIRANNWRLEVDSVEYDVIKLFAVVPNHDAVVDIEVELEKPRACSFYERLDVCGRGKCEAIRNIPYCRCPNGVPSSTCPDERARDDSSEESRDDHYDDEDDDDGDENLDLMIVSIVLGLIGLLLLIASVSICFYRHHAAVKRNRLERRRMLLNARRPTPAFLPVYRPMPIVATPPIHFSSDPGKMALHASVRSLNAMDNNPYYIEAPLVNVSAIQPAMWPRDNQFLTY